jgi:hypothetical protein
VISSSRGGAAARRGNGAAGRAVAQVAGRACASRSRASMAAAQNGGWEHALGFRALGCGCRAGWAGGDAAGPSLQKCGYPYPFTSLFFGLKTVVRTAAAITYRDKTLHELKSSEEVTHLSFQISPY